MNEDIPSARARDHRSEFSYGDRSEQRVDSTKNPDTDEKLWSRKLRGDFTGHPQDAHADRATDRDGESEADAEHAQQCAL